jgi:deoxycytidylate deaminase
MCFGISNNNIKYFNVAKEVSRLSNFHKQHIGCVVVYKHQIISVGYNQTKTHTLQAIYNRYRDIQGKNIQHSIHAEIDALLKIRFFDIDWSKVHIYIYRDHKTTKQLMISKPCPACMAYIKSFGIRHIYYTDDNAYCYLKLVG